MIFKTRHKGQALENFVFTTLKVKDERTCRSQCFIHQRCLSYNYVPDAKTCELSESDHLMHPNKLVPRPEALYSTAEVKKFSWSTGSHDQNKIRYFKNYAFKIPKHHVWLIDFPVNWRRLIYLCELTLVDWRIYELTLGDWL